MAGYTTAFLEGRDKLIFNNTTFDALTGVTQFYFSFHTADPAPNGVGDQDNSEVAFTPYARPSCPRSSAGILVTGAVKGLVNAAQLAKGTAGAANASWVGMGTAPTGAGFLIWSAPLDAILALAINQQGQIDDDSFWRDVVGDLTANG
jgi:hypothetical protein